MEAPVLLVAVQRIVGDVEIEDDLPRGLRVHVEEQIDEQALDGFCIVADAIIARRSAGRRVFEPVES